MDLGLTSHPGRSQCFCLPCSCAVYDGHQHSLWGFSNGNLSAVSPAIWFFIHFFRLYGLIPRSFPSFLWMVLLHWWEYDAGTQESLRTEYDFYRFLLSLFSRHSFENEVMMHHCRELVRQDLHCSHLCKLYSRLGITDMIEAGRRFVHVDTQLRIEVFFSWRFHLFILQSSLHVPGNLHDCWWCLSQLTSQNDRWRGPLIHHRFGIGWPSWTQLNSNWQSPFGKCFVSAACEELDKSQLIWAALSDSNVKICMAGVTCALMVWISLGGATAWHPRISDVGFHAYFSSSSMDFVSVLKVVVIIQFTQSDEKSKGWMLSSESASPRWRLQGFSASVQTNEPYEPFELLSVWTLLILWAFSPEAPKCDCFLNLVQCMEFGNSHPSHPRQEMASSQAFELWSISSGFAVKPSSHIATRCRHGKSVRPWERAHRNIAGGATKASDHIILLGGHLLK